MYNIDSVFGNSLVLCKYIFVQFCAELFQCFPFPRNTILYSLQIIIYVYNNITTRFSNIKCKRINRSHTAALYTYNIRVTQPVVIYHHCYTNGRISRV